jgi:L-fuconolactonase
MDSQVIDTHLHLWNFEKARYSWLDGDTSLLNRTYNFEEIREEQKSIGITGSVLVQAANNFEDTDWMLEVAASEPSVLGVVGWLPLMQPEQTQKVLNEKYLRNSYFKGIRHLIHDEADPRWLLQDSVIESLEILAANKLPYDVVGVLPQHIEMALAVAKKIPLLKMVFDHLNGPPISNGGKFDRWQGLMKEASQLPNFYAKISGLGTVTKKQNWGAEDIKPFVGFALENFGEDKCFCGSDWPVCLLAGSFSHTWQVYKEVIGSFLNEAHQKKVYADNARAFYAL